MTFRAGVPLCAPGHPDAACHARKINSSLEQKQGTSLALNWRIIMKHLLMAGSVLALLASTPAVAEEGIVKTKESCVLAAGVCVKLRGPVY